MTVIMQLALVLGAAALLGAAAKALRQPPLLAYLLAGALIGYFGLFHFDGGALFGTFSDFGVMFLLFLVGLDINYTSLRLVGKPSVLVGLGQVVFTFIVGFFISRALGFLPLEAMYVAIALTFSSTIIIVQLLSEKRALNSLYGKLSVGMLLTQDFVAIVILILLAGLAGGTAPSPATLAGTVLGGVVLLFGMLFLARNFFPWLFDKLAHARGLIFLASVAWLFIVAAVMERIGFSIEIGGFLAGLALANSVERFEIASRMRPLRDFFIVLFFVMLGTSLFLADFSGLLLPIIALSLFVLVGNPLIVFLIMRALRYTHRTSFLTGLTVAQISEFSLIIAALGARVGHLSDRTVALITAVGIITITVSTYFIVKGDALYAALRPCLKFLDRRRTDGEAAVPDETIAPRILLIGGHRTGQAFLKKLRRKRGVVVVDFDPDIVRELTDAGYHVLFGDISNVDLLEKIDLDGTKTVISTSPTLGDNLTLLEHVEQYSEHEQKQRRPRVIMRAESAEEERVLRQNGADDVFIPEEMSGTLIAELMLG